jgi:hypothetical protein
VQYPLKYRKHFPAQLYEKVMSTVWPFCSEGIMNSDGEIVADSTCGFRTDLVDVMDVPIVDYSGGFCCSCPAMTVLTGMSDGVYRGDCGLLSSDETAHCLEFSDTLFAGYSISDFYYDYDITLDLAYKKNDVVKNDESETKEEEENVVDETKTETQQEAETVEKKQNSIFSRFLTEETPPQNEEINSEEEILTETNAEYEIITEVLSINRKAATNKILSAEIIGDYMPTKPPPDLKDKILLRPLPQKVPVEAEGKVQNDWMIVNPGMVSMDGSECDKIGFWLFFGVIKRHVF